MGTILASYIADGAWTKVNEATGGAAVRWPTAEALRWINDGQRVIVGQLPQANSKKATPTLVASSSRQDLAGLSITDGISIIDVRCNLDAAGAVRGRPVTLRERQWFDHIDGWHATDGAQVVHWMQDERDPKAFYIWPQPALPLKLEILYSAYPVAIAAIGNAITLDDVYADHLHAYLLYSFYSKDTNSASYPTKAQAYWQQFLDLLGVRGTNLSGNERVTAQKAV